VSLEKKAGVTENGRGSGLIKLASMCWQSMNMKNDSKLSSTILSASTLSNRLMDVSMLSGGADSSVHLWDLESRGSDLKHLYKTIASVNK